MKEIIKKDDIWNSHRMLVIDEAIKFIINNIVPDYLKYEFVIFHLNPKYKFSQVEKIKKITKYLLNEKKDQG